MLNVVDTLDKQVTGFVSFIPVTMERGGAWRRVWGEKGWAWCILCVA
jgi:hypothetical protein